MSMQSFKKLLFVLGLIFLPGVSPVSAQTQEKKEMLTEVPDVLPENHPYDVEQTTAPLFSVNASGRNEETAGNSRVNEDAPVVFMIGDSTMKNGSGKGDGGQWGWGSFFEWFFDTDRVSVENHALGGRSSRTFYTEGLWDKVLSGIKKGDYLFIQFGHNDGGPLNTGRARASLKGVGNESETVIMERHGGPEEVFTFGHYLRIYVRQAKARGANVILLSHTPGNSWTGERMNRNDQTYGKWTKQIAGEEGVPYIDMNDITARKFDAMGKDAAAAYFVDRVHTTFEGAIMNCKSAIEGLLQLNNYPLNDYILMPALDRDYEGGRQAPSIFSSISSSDVPPIHTSSSPICRVKNYQPSNIFVAPSPVMA